MKGSRKSMDSFFERYGRVIIVAVAICFVLLLFTPMKNKIGDNINGFVGNFANQTNKSLNEVRMPDELGAGDILEIEGKKYIAINHIENDKYLVMTSSSIGDQAFQASDRSDGQNRNTYEDSKIDNYLENDWYNSLSPAMKAAIQATNIKQASYKTYNDPDSKQETGYNGQVYNTISRHVYLPSVLDFNELINLKDSTKVKKYLNGNTAWTRDSAFRSTTEVMYLSSSMGGLSCIGSLYPQGTYPAFTVDLSKIDYKVIDTVKYK